jgi:hypothetical protein
LPFDDWLRFLRSGSPSWKNVAIELIMARLGSSDLVWLISEQAESTFPNLPGPVRAILISIELRFIEP